MRTCGDYVEDMLIFAQCSINILSNHRLVTSTLFRPQILFIRREERIGVCWEEYLAKRWMQIQTGNPCNINSPIMEDGTHRDDAAHFFGRVLEIAAAPPEAPVNCKLLR